MRTPLALAVFSFPFLTFQPVARALDYLGADALLKQVEAQSADAKDSAHKPGLTRQILLDLKSYQERAASLPPDQAAREWLALFDRAVKLPEPPDQSGYYGKVPPRLLPVMAVLPPPAVWDALAVQVAARPLPTKGPSSRPAAVLRIVAGMLQSKHDHVREAIDRLTQLDKAQEEAGGGYDMQVDQLQDAFLTLTDDKHAVLANFEAKLALLKPDAGSDAHAARTERLRSNELPVPDLVALVGAGRAEALLKEIFSLELDGVEIRGSQTKAFARKVALEMGSRLKFAPWNLVDSLDSAPLYEILDRQFSGNADHQSNRPQAQNIYLLSLISRGRTEEATTLALKINRTTSSSDGNILSGLPEEALTDLAGKGYAKEVFHFFDHLLAAHPESSYWKTYTEVAVLAGETDAMLAKIKAASERPGLAAGAKTTLRESYGSALLAADHVSEALPILRGLAATKQAAFEDADDGSKDNNRQGGAGEMATLADIGQLLGDDLLVKEQLDGIVKATKSRPDALDNMYLPNGADLNDIFLAAKRGPEREQMLSARLAKSLREMETSLAQMPAGPSSSEQEEYGTRATQEPLHALADLYFQAGRYQDIMTLLDRAASWGEEDVAKLFSFNRCSSWPGFGYQVARALQKTGHADQALRVINACLERDGGHDPSYALLLELLPPDQAEARLNVLFQGDQFEERPLIWRAVLQLGQGRLDEAEKSARQAISIDPSDGEEGRGDRMRAYAVLGDILERKGDPEKAATMRQAVQAIRLSEDADRFHAAGLLTRAVGLYEKALGYFADAYCIQSRLAIQLTTLGKLDEAAAHYERAYELMPESFGRMESHCFGCERAFKGERAEATAERVFQRLVAKQPDNPRVHYLLGYLRGEQERNAEAAHEYREAVRLDPDYINAWLQLAATTDDPADRDRAELNLLRLDPHRHHDRVDFSNVSDLRALWSAVETVAKDTPPDATNLYPLAASKAFLDQQRQLHPPKPPADDAELTKAVDSTDEALTPRKAILTNEVIAQALQLLRGSDVDASDRVTVVQ